MHSFDRSTLVIEAEAIINSTEVRKNWTYQAQFIVGNVKYPVLKVVTIDEEADYTIDFADNIKVEMMIGGGTYTKKILPFKENLRLQLDKVPNGLFGNDLRNEAIETRMFNVMIEDVESPDMAGSTPEYAMSADALDIGNIMRIRVELTDINVDLIRTATFGTVLVAKRPSEAIESVLTQMGSYITRDIESKILGVDVHPGDNSKIIEQFVIPHGTRFVDFPDYLHNRVGVYNSGLGFFYKDRRFYVWPLYNFKRSENVEKKVTFIIAPQNRFPGVEKTYRTTANQTVVLITGGAKTIDTSEHFAQTEGSGIRMADTTALLEGFAKVSKGIAAVKRSEGVSEFVGMLRAGELNKVATRPSSNNLYKETSSIAARLGNRMMVVWENADPSLLKPNVAAEVMIEKDGLPVILPATILAVHSYTGSPSNSIAAGMHRTVCLVTLYVDRTTDEVAKYRDEINKDWYNKMTIE